MHDHLPVDVNSVFSSAYGEFAATLRIKQTAGDYSRVIVLTVKMLTVPFDICR